MEEPAGSPSKTRDLSIDIVRGLAIVTMVGANMAPLLPEPHSMILRFYSTFAAPIFVALAGTMVALASLSKKSAHGFSYFLQRGIFLMMIGAFLDVVAWKYIPFVGVDVLYLIGLSMPLLYLVSRMPASVSLLVALIVFVLTPIIQNALGYAEVPLTPSIFSNWSEVPFVVVVKHWMIDGWFPVFPWLGYGMVGVFIGKWRWANSPKINSFARLVPGMMTLMLLFGGGLAMYFFPGPLYSREGYSELFYPSTLGFIALSFGVNFALFMLVDATTKSRVWEWFRLFGEASLFMYIAHSLVIGLLFESIWPTMTTSFYLCAYAALMLVLTGCGHLLRNVKQNYKGMPLTLKWVVGG